MRVRFTKMHGLGNDFVLIEDLADELDFAPEAIQWVCDRNFGIGADGVILVRRATSDDADYFMLYYNSDGTTAEMCGNGVRCFAKFVVDEGLVPADRSAVVVETLGGLRPVEVLRGADGKMLSATVDMGEPVLTPALIPTTLPGNQVFECPIETGLGSYRVTAVSMGNPHAVIWVDNVDDAPVDSVGPLVERHPAFPQRTNVEFAELVDERTIRLRVWERGVGETLACGTGACATLVAAVLACKTGREADVQLPGGALAIKWAEDGRVHMTGPAAAVFVGELDVPDEA